MAQRQQYEALQKTLVDARQAKGLTQTEVAACLGKPQSFVSKYESGERRLDVVEFLDICRALAVSPDRLLGEIQHGRT